MRGNELVVTLAFVATMAAGGTARAQPTPQPTDPSTGTSTDPNQPEPPPDDPERDPIEALEEENARLKERIDALEDEQRYLGGRLDSIAPSANKVTGYLDFGFFTVSGDGTGIRNDAGHGIYPEYAAIPDSWVFLGDPLSTVINSRGDPATTGESRAITFDPIKGRSATFLVNNLSLGLFAGIGQNGVFNAKVDIVPRSRDVSQSDGLFIGDYVDLRLGYYEYRIARQYTNISLFAGKFESVFGFEYRTQDAPSRIEVTPSLICRYTCGNPLGVKARMQFLNDHVIANVAITNGSSFVEGFPFNNETDANDMKTASGRFSIKMPFAQDIEIGVSGMYGAQDGQIKDDIYQWMYGADFHLEQSGFILRGEFVQGRAPGETQEGGPACDITACLRFKGAYGLMAYRLTNIVVPYARVDWREAVHRDGLSFVYVSNLLRATPGIRLDVNANLIIKAEYTFDRELGRIPQFHNDLFTSSIVVKY